MEDEVQEEPPAEDQLPPVEQGEDTEQEHPRPEEEEDRDTEPSDSEASHRSDMTNPEEAANDLVYLGEDHCRVTQTSRVGSTRVPSVCGKLSADCQRAVHQQKRSVGWVNPVGAYTRLQTGSGFQHHGQFGLTYLTSEEWRAMQDPESQPEVRQRT